MSNDPRGLVRSRNTGASFEHSDDIYVRSLSRAIEADLAKGMAEYNALKKNKIADVLENGAVDEYDAKVLDITTGEFVDLYPASSENQVFKEKRVRKGKYPDRIIDWSLPGKDTLTTERTRCGTLVTVPTESGERSPIIHSCSEDHLHYADAQKRSCYRLSCSKCWSDASVKIATKAEPKVLAHKFLELKADRSEMTEEELQLLFRDTKVSHWTLTFRQDSSPGKGDGLASKVACMVRTARGFEKFCEMVRGLFLEAGLKGGVMVFHPWAWDSKLKRWIVRPHVHVIGYGWLNTKAFQNKYSPGINLKKIHASKEVESVKDTLTYLVTHAGIMKVEKKESEIDWNGRFIGSVKRLYKMKALRDEPFLFEDVVDPNRLMDIDMEVDDSLQVQKRLGSFVGEDNSIFSEFDRTTYDMFSDDPFWEQFEQRMGKMDADTEEESETPFSNDDYFNPERSVFNGFNWTQFVMGAYSKHSQTITYFGCCSTKKIRVFGIYKEKAMRVCPECGSQVCSYIHDGNDLRHTQDLYYIKNSPIYCKDKDYVRMMALYQKYKTDLNDNGLSLLDFARMCPQLVSPEDMNIQEWVDDDILAMRQHIASQTVVNIRLPSGTIDVKLMTKAEAREAGYIRFDEICPEELDVIVEELIEIRQYNIDHDVE